MTYLCTVSGRQVDYLNPTADSIIISDIAQALAHTCRYSGHVHTFYSVAQHSVFVSHIVPEEFALEALLHDAAEAYCCDIPSPLKHLLPDYKRIENRFDWVIREKFGLPPLPSPIVKRADLIALATEKRDMFIDPHRTWPVLNEIEPSTRQIVPHNSHFAEVLFMARFRELCKEPMERTDLSALKMHVACSGDDGFSDMLSDNFTQLILSAIAEIKDYRYSGQQREEL
ncbi:HD family hydrolase [Limnobaculum xujianqingii]|uniref:HD family hydrolase n=1 Tax=Limnobaculum xujianqingii TaxID=2738837 RepID=UPI002AC327CB|nr:HD family hydrolase [Limnobaculum xujianqingii]